MRSPNEPAADIVAVEFDEQQHIYTIDGRRWPSVTQILERVGITDYSDLPANPHRAYYLARGRAIHIALKMWCSGHRKEVEDYCLRVPEWANYVHAGCAWLEQSDFKPLLVEPILLNPVQRYVGRADLIGRIGDRFVVPDWKLTRARPATAIQTAAYQSAIPFLGEIPPVGCGYIYADEDHERLGVPLLKTGRFGRTELYDDVEDFGIWQAALSCFFWAENHRATK